jgi:HSP20 family protein
MLPTIRKNNFFPSVFDEIFNDSLFTNSTNSYKTPKVNVSEDDKSYQIELSAPGMDKSDFKIEVKDDVLIISSEKKEEKREEKKNYTRREFSHYNFSRSFVLPEIANIDEIGAAYKDGILNVTIEKKEIKEKETKLIDIQ